MHDILKLEEKLKAFQAQLDSGDCRKKRSTMRDSDFPELDRVVFTWFIQERCKVHSWNYIAQRSVLECSVIQCTVFMRHAICIYLKSDFSLIINALLCQAVKKRASALVQPRIDEFLKKR